jgi:hypothetical protein
LYGVFVLKKPENNMHCIFVNFYFLMNNIIFYISQLTRFYWQKWTIFSLLGQF